MTMVAFANETPAIRCGRENLRGSWDRLAQAVRTIFPHKTAYHFSDLTGLKLRACEYFLSRKTATVSADALIALLDTEHGPQVLTTLLEHSKQPWVKEFKRLWQAERIKSEMALLQQRLDQLKIESL